MRLEFTVPGNPIPWKRARSQGKRRFNDPSTERWKAAVYLASYWGRPIAAWGDQPWPLDKTYRVSVDFYRKNDTGTDLDRLLNAVLDGMEGQVYVKDRQVKAFGAVNLFVDRKNPRAEIIVEVIGGA